jgi:hypothetical protein
MSDEPMILNLTIDSYDAEAEERVGRVDPSKLTLFRSDVSENIVEAIRAHVVSRLDYMVGVAVVLRDSLDFDAPNQPTMQDLAGIVKALEDAAEHARTLMHLAPEQIEDDDDA